MNPECVKVYYHRNYMSVWKFSAFVFNPVFFTFMAFIFGSALISTVKDNNLFQFVLSTETKNDFHWGYKFGPSQWVK